MLKNRTRRIVTFFTSLCLLFSSLAGGVNAAMVGTDAAVNAGQRAEQISQIQGWLSQEQVRDQLVAMGVEPEKAAERVSSLTSEELRTLHEQIDELPAGGALIEVIGIVFVVLLILELVGVTNIFAHI